eukprot:scaffold24476_cov62-Phaeocystis_antarctica.AAC.1
MTPAPPVRAPRRRTLDWRRASATLWGYGQRVAHRVPDLQLDLLVVYRDHARAELDADGQVVHWLEALVRELQEQARLPDAGVADDDVPARCTEAAQGCGQRAACMPFSAPQLATATRPSGLTIDRQRALAMRGRCSTIRVEPRGRRGSSCAVRGQSALEKAVSRAGARRAHPRPCPQPHPHPHPRPRARPC